MSEVAGSDSTTHAKGFWGVHTPFAPSRCPFFYGWMIVFAATLGSIFSIPGQTMGFTVFTDVLMKELGLTRVELSLAYCLGTVCSGLTLPWLGRVLDRWGERKMAVTSTIATGVILFYLAACAPISNGLARILPAGIAAFIVIGVGFYLVRAAAQGVLSMTCRNAIGKWFDHKRGLAMASSSILVSFSFALSPKLMEWLMERHGYDGAWVVMGIGTIVVMGPLAWLLFRDTPEEDGLRMDGSSTAVKTYNNPDMHIEREFTRERIINLFVPIAATSVVTNLIFGAINARMRLKFLLLIMNLGCIAAATGMLHLNHTGGEVAYVLGNGIASGGFVSLSGIVFPRFYGREHLGAISGVNMSVMVIGSGLGPLLFGACHHFADSYRLILIVSAIIPAVLALLSLRADNPQIKSNTKP